MRATDLRGILLLVAVTAVGVSQAQQLRVRSRIGQGIESGPSISPNLETVLSTMTYGTEQIPDRIVIARGPRYAPDTILYPPTTEYQRPVMCADASSFLCIRRSNSTDGRLERIDFRNRVVWSQSAPGTAGRIRQATNADVSAYLDGSTVRFLRSSDGTQLGTYFDPNFNSSTQVTLSADGSTFMTGLRVVKVIRRSDNQLLFSHDLTFYDLAAMGMSWNGRYAAFVLYAYDGNGTVHYYLKVRDTLTGSELPTPAWKSMLTSVCFSPDGTEYLVGTASGIDIVSTVNGQRQRSLALPRLPGSARAQWSADGSRILILEHASGETESWMYDALTGQLLSRGSMELKSFQFERNSSLGLCQLGDQFASVDPLTGKTLKFYGGKVTTVLGSGTGPNRTLITATVPATGKVDFRRFDIQSGALLGQSQIVSQGDEFAYFRVRPGTFQASMNRLRNGTHELVIVDTLTAATIDNYATGNRLFPYPNWSRDGRWWRHASYTGAYLLDYGLTGAVTQIQGDFAGGTGSSWSGDGQFYAHFDHVGNVEKLIIRRTSDMEIVNSWPLPNGAEYGKALGYSPSSKKIWAVVGAYNWPVRLVTIDTTTGVCTWADPLPDAVEDCEALLFSDDGRYLAVVSGEGFVTIAQLPILTEKGL